MSKAGDSEWQWTHTACNQLPNRRSLRVAELMSASQSDSVRLYGTGYWPAMRSLGTQILGLYHISYKNRLKKRNDYRESSVDLRLNS